jgi:NADP-dependent 3-hydroxy acid dehydrogenase YdfG
MESKVALITGATSGIGLAILEMLSKKGFVVDGVGRMAETAERLVEEAMHTLYVVKARRDGSVRFALNCY